MKVCHILRVCPQIRISIDKIKTNYSLHPQNISFRENLLLDLSNYFNCKDPLPVLKIGIQLYLTYTILENYWSIFNIYISDYFSFINYFLALFRSFVLWKTNSFNVNFKKCLESFVPKIAYKLHILFLFLAQLSIYSLATLKNYRKKIETASIVPEENVYQHQLFSIRFCKFCYSFNECRTQNQKPSNFYTPLKNEIK